MDAGIMDGSSRRAVGVLCLRYPKHPIRLARLLLGKTTHVMLGCEYADKLAMEYGLEKHTGPHPRALAMYEWARERARMVTRGIRVIGSCWRGWALLGILLVQWLLTQGAIQQLA